MKTPRFRLEAGLLPVVLALLACGWSSRNSGPALDDAGPQAAASEIPESLAVPVKPKPGYVEVTVGGVAMSDKGNVVFLLDPEKKTAVPIVVGESEAFSIQLRLEDRRFRRPLTHDLFDSAVDRLGGRVENVRIDQVKSNTFHATLVLRRGSDRHELDARSSDAIAIAIGNGAPIHMSSSVVRSSGVDVAQLEGLEKSPDPPLMPRDPEEDPIRL